MKETKFKTKPEKSADGFFEFSDENSALGFANDIKFSKIETDTTSENRFFVKVLKQIFLFLPGAFLLFYTSFAAAVIFMETVIFRREVQTLPDDFLLQFAFIGLIILVGTLMTWFGLGDIKNRKHFAIPASLMLTGAAVGAISKALSNISTIADKMLDDFGYAILLFPLALIVPVLAKGIVDRKADDAQNQ